MAAADTVGPAGAGEPLEWRPVPGFSATKLYRCPWCEQVILPGTPHIVVWPQGRLEQRRHWHTPCWRRRR